MPIKRMSICKNLWDIWFVTYLIVINTHLIYHAINDYCTFKANSLDPVNGRHWNMNLAHLILECIIIPLGLLPIIIYTNIVPQGNFANDGRVLGKDDESFHFAVDENGKASVMLTNKSQSCRLCRSHLMRLVQMELPPTSYMLQVIAAYCYLIPRPFMDAQQIYHNVLKPNQIWHTDLDIFFDPDVQHFEFTNFQQWSYIQPVSAAYFNLAFSLIVLSYQYCRVFWNVSRTFTLVFSFIMIVFSLHVLIEYCSFSVLIKISANKNLVGIPLRLSINAFTIQSLSVIGNIILLLSFTTVFHYGILQYGDMIFHKNRRIRRQMISSSPQIIGSNQIDMPVPFSPCVSENNYSESSIEPIFSKSHLSHVFAISFIFVVVCLKAPVVILSAKHIYSTTSDSLTLVNMFVSCLFLVSWLKIWFAFALRRTWNFKVKSNAKSNTDPILMNGNTLINNNGHMQLQQMQNSYILNPKSSELNLSKHEMLTANRNAALDGCSDETDMSSKMSSNNYVLLQAMRNGSMGFDMNGQASLLRNPLYLSYSLNNPGIQNANLIYANEDTLNLRSTHLEDQLGSEHSYNSNRSRNMGFDPLPPTLPNFDESRYKILNQNSAAMDKLIPRYLRSASVDMNGSLHLSMPNSEVINPTPTTTTMSYTYDSNFQNYNNRFKQINMSGSQMRSPEKFSKLNKLIKSGELVDFSPDDESQKRGFLNGDPIQSLDSIKRVVKSPIMFQTVEENVGDTHQTESDSLHAKFGNTSVLDIVSGSSTNTSLNDMKNNNATSNQTNDRMCSQV